MTPSPKRINRYTTLPVLVDMLRRRLLVLLDPKAWDDKNDTEVLLEYKRRKKLKSLFALCCSLGDETIHHWQTFAPGMSGCCIEFHTDQLTDLLQDREGIRLGPVVYKRIKELDDRTIRVNAMPFTKRWPYRCEEEYRIIWESRKEAIGYEVGFDLRMICKITINQRMPDQVYATIRDYLRSTFKDPDQKINRSTLYENKTWIGKFRKT